MNMTSGQWGERAECQEDELVLMSVSSHYRAVSIPPLEQIVCPCCVTCGDGVF